MTNPLCSHVNLQWDTDEVMRTDIVMLSCVTCDWCSNVNYQCNTWCSNANLWQVNDVKIVTLSHWFTTI